MNRREEQDKKIISKESMGLQMVTGTNIKQTFNDTGLFHLCWWRVVLRSCCWAPASTWSMSSAGGTEHLSSIQVNKLRFQKRLTLQYVFAQTGMNGILMYMGHQVASGTFPWHWISGPMNTHFERLVESLWGTSLWVLIATWLYHKKIFLAL